MKAVSSNRDAKPGRGTGLDGPEPDGVRTARADVNEWQDEERGYRVRLRRRAVTVHGTRILVLVIVLILWQILPGRVVQTLFVPKLWSVVTQLGTWIEDGTLAENFATTIEAMLLGLLVGTVAGAVCGYALGVLRMAGRVFEPFVSALYSLPLIAIAPLFILWLGIGISSKIALTAVVVFFLIFYNVYAGVRSTSEDLVQAVTIMGGKSIDIARYVIVPAAAAWLITGLRMAVPMALVGTIVGEFVASEQGLGHLITEASGTFNSAGVFAALVVLMVVSSLIRIGLEFASNRILRWRETDPS
jgi:NitT/TauT family transport system permease protein